MRTTQRLILAAAMSVMALNAAYAQQPKVDTHTKLVGEWRTYLDNGGEVNTADENGNTPLMMAVARRNTGLIQLFLERGADVNARNNINGTALMFAASKSPEICQWLLEKGAEVDAEDDDSATALHYSLGHSDKGMTQPAYRFGHDETAFWFLLEKGLDINARTKQGENALYLAIQNTNCDEKFIEQMLEKGADPNVQTVSDWETPLYKAFKRSNVAMCMMLLDAGAEVNLYNTKGLSPIFFAAECWDEKLIDKFLEKGASLDDVSRDGHTLLYAAAKAGDIQLAQRILDAGVDINAASVDGMTPLIAALMENNQQMAKFLLDRGATFEENKLRPQSARDPFVYAALQNAVMNGDLELCKFLVKKGARFMDDPADPQKFLICAVINGDANLCRYVYNFNPKVDVFSSNPRNNTHYAALHMAVAKMQYDICIFLLSKGADINLQNRHGHTPLIYAVINHSPPFKSPGNTILFYEYDRQLQRIVALLLEEGADIGIKNNNGHTIGDYLFHESYYAKFPFTRKYFTSVTGICRTRDVPAPIHIAAMGGKLEEVKEHLKDGVDINLKDVDNETALHFAIRGNRADVCEYLLENGADVHAPGIFGGTALHYAASLGRDEFIPLLVKHGAEVDRQTKDRDTTPLHWAVDSSQGKCVQALVKNGANMALIDHVGRTPFSYAMEYRKESYCKYFCQSGFDVNEVVRENTITALLPPFPRLEMLRQLKELGLDVNVQDKNGSTPLYEVRREPDMVLFLLENGADPTIRNNAGKLPSDTDGIGWDKVKNRIRRTFGIQADTTAQ